MKIKLKVLEYINNNADLQMQPKTIARDLKLKHNTVKVICYRLHKEGEILKTVNGFYQSKKITVKPNNARYHELKLHRIHIITDDLNENETLKGDGVPICNPKIETMTHRHRINHAIVEEREFNGRWFTFTHHYQKSNKIEIRSKLTDNPMSYHDFRYFTAFLSGLYPYIPLSKYKIVEIEFNIDIRVFGLDDKNATLNLKLFENAWLKMYQKTKDMIRIETYVHDRIDMATALNILYKFVETVDKEYLHIKNIK